MMLHKLNKKGITTMVLVSLFIAVAIIAVSAIYLFQQGMILLPAYDSLQPSKCQLFANDKKLSDFAEQIPLASAKTIDNKDNYMYDPEEAIKLFMQYESCKDSSKFDSEEIASLEPMILSCADASFINWALEIQSDLKNDLATTRDMKTVQNYHKVFKMKFATELASAPAKCDIPKKA